MVVCKYFRQGNCRFGANCRFEHPGSNSNSNSNSTSNNRFNSLSGGPGGNNRGKSSALNLDDIRSDMSPGKGRPSWLLSAYGPGKDPAASLLVDNEFSPEEVRLRFYELQSQGRANDADQEAITLWNKADSETKDVASKPNDVIRFLQEAERKHPNRHDWCKMDGRQSRDQYVESFTRNDGNKNNPSSSATPFGSGQGFGQPNNSNPFGKPNTNSPFGQPATNPAFAQPAFGQSGLAGNNPGNAFAQANPGSAFGQPAFGQATQPVSAFGQPNQPASSFGQSSLTSPFSKPAAASGFGQAQPSSSPFGQTGQSQPAFGQSGFGQQPQDSAFSKPAFGGSGFGQTPQPNQASPFGRPAASSFGQPGFGQLSQPSQPAFGQSTFGQSQQPAASAAPSAFGTTPTAFGQPSQFGQSPFAAQSSQTNPPPFGQTPTMPDAAAEIASAPEVSMDGAQSRPTTQGNPFSASALNKVAATPDTTASVGSEPIVIGQQVPLHYTETLPDQPIQMNGGQIIRYRGQRVEYVEKLKPTTEGEMTVESSFPCYSRPDRKGLERIWFPNGPAEASVQFLAKEEHKLDFQGSAEQYTDAVKGQYKHLLETGSWKDGKVPLVPPMREWIAYDF